MQKVLHVLKFLLELYQISAPAPTNLKFGDFSEIRPSPTLAKFLTRFGRCQCSMFSYLSIQESCAIAKMTVQCTLHMGAMKIFRTP